MDEKNSSIISPNIADSDEECWFTGRHNKDWLTDWLTDYLLSAAPSCWPVEWLAGAQLWETEHCRHETVGRMYRQRHLTAHRIWTRSPPPSLTKDGPAADDISSVWGPGSPPGCDGARAQIDRRRMSLSRKRFTVHSTKTPARGRLWFALQPPSDSSAGSGPR